MVTISTLSGRVFEQAQGQTLLDAATQQGLVMPYSCRTGRCSTCKVRVLSGESLALTDELGLSSEEKNDGWVLSCVRSAKTNAQIEVEDLGDTPLPLSKTWPCRISALEPLAADVLRVQLRLPPRSVFAYRAGQYIDLIGPGGVRRSYSMADVSEDFKIELQIRKVPGGAMSDYLFSAAKPDDLLRLTGPLGTFFLRDVTDKDVVFLATGTGIAPVQIMLKAIGALGKGHLPRSVSVYWGGRQPEDLYMPLESQGLSNWRFVPVLSRADGATWAGATGHVQNQLLKDRSNFSNAVVYACGSDAMIRSAKKQLTQAGLLAQHFFSDTFVCSAPTSH